MLVALNLRAAVVSLPPIYDAIAASFPISIAARSLMGALPLVCFAMFGLLARSASRRFGLEKSLLIAMAMVATGEFARAALSHSMLVFGSLSVICLGGMGMGNVLLPPAITHYFRDRVGTISGLFQVLMVVSASLPSLIAVPTTEALGWRTSVGLWSVLGLLAMLPWLRLTQAHDARDHPVSVASFAAWRWPTAWAIMIVFSMGPLVMYAMIAWLPQLLVDTAGVTRESAGTMLAVYNAVGLVHSMLIPVILTKLKRPFLVVLFAIACLATGTLGLAYAPHLPWPWIILAGAGAMLLNVGLTLVNMRSRTEEGTTALSSFVQSGGYLIAGFGPIVVGYLHLAAGSWIVPCWFMASTGIVAALAAVVALRPVYIEDAVLAGAASGPAGAA
ncbi:MAG: MFS transporter [Janthinobacterium lividum]